MYKISSAPPAAAKLAELIVRQSDQLRQAVAGLEKHDKVVRDAHDNLKHLKVSQHEKETTLKATHQQIAKYEKQLDTAASKKEFDALQTEIAHAKGKCAALEDEILSTMGEIDDRTAEIPVVEKALLRLSPGLG